MQYDITLPREVTGNELIEALERVASKHKWPYYDEVVARSVTLNSGSLDVYDKTLQVIMDPKQRFLGVFRCIGKIGVEVSLDRKYSSITINPARPRNVDGIEGIDRVTKTTLDTFVKSLYLELG